MERTTTNGLETAIAPARAQTRSGQVVDLVVSAYRIDQRAYHFVTIAPAGSGQAFTPMLRSLRALSQQEAAALRSRRIELVDVTARDTAEGLARRMAFDDYQLERFLAQRWLGLSEQVSGFG